MMKTRRGPSAPRKSPSSKITLSPCGHLLFPATHDGIVRRQHQRSEVRILRGNKQIAERHSAGYKNALGPQSRFTQLVDFGLKLASDGKPFARRPDEESRVECDHSLLP